eukprot:816997_1
MNQLNINNNEAKQSDLPPNRKRKVPEDGAEEYDALIVLHRIEDIVAKIAGNFEFGSTVHATRPTPKQLKSLQDDIHSLDPIFRLSSKLIYKIQSKRITALVQKNKYIRFIENTTLDMVKTGQMNKYKFWTSFDPLRFQLPHPVRHRLLLDRLARDNLQSNVADLRTVVTALDQVIDIYNKDIESMLLASLADYKEYLRKISDDKEVTKDTWNIDSILFKLDPTLYEQRRKWTEQSRIDQQTEAFVTLVGTNNAQLVNNMSYKHNFIKRINPAASILKRAYSFLDSSINNLINNRMSRKYFHPFHYARKRNHDQQTHSTLQSIKMSNITIAQVDKNMGDIAIPRSRLDAVVLEHLNGSNYTPLFESEYIISTRIRNNVIQLKDKHESYLGETFALSRKFIALKFKILKEINNNDWTPLPTMRPMIKIHKATEKWRYITNPGDFYTGMHSSWTNDECMGLTALLMVKYDKEFILENSADYVNSLGDLPQLKPNHWRFSIDMDVKSLYDSMDLMQCMNIIINTIKREIPRYNPYRLDHLEDIIILFQQNTVVKWRLMNGEIVIFKMISGVGTGYSHSGGL